jgi:hypothetical protein
MMLTTVSGAGRLYCGACLVHAASERAAIAMIEKFIFMRLCFFVSMFFGVFRIFGVLRKIRIKELLIIPNTGFAC